MKYSLRLFALLLALMTVLPVAVACKKDNSPAEETTVPDFHQTEPEEALDGLPEGLKFDGESVKIFYANYDANFDNKNLELEGTVEGDGVSKAVFARNLSVEQRLDIELNFHEAQPVPGSKEYRAYVDNLILNAADETVDIIYHRGADAVVHSNSGYFRNVADLKYLDIDQPYWFADQMKSLSLNNKKIYVLMGDLLTSNYGNMTAMFFNKELFDRTFSGGGVTSATLYDMAKEGKWTWEEYFKLVKDAYRDDGDGVKSLGDTFGAHTEIGSRTATYYPYTSGVAMSYRNEEGYPALSMWNVDTVAMTEQLYSFVYENEGTFRMTYEEAENSFFNGKLMFYAYFLSRGTSIRSNVSFDYGVLPYPKFTENHPYTTAVLTGAGVYVIPRYLSENKLDVVGATLEALCSESSRTVAREYYDVVLKVRQSGGEEDAEMIDLIRDHVNSDFTFWNSSSIGKPAMFFREIVIDGASKDVASAWKRNGSSYETALRNLIEADIAKGNK